MRVEAVQWDDAAASTLRAAQRAELAERYGTPDSEPGPAPTADDISAFFVAFTEDDQPVGCAGLRQLTDDEAEVKRMFVAPMARGTGASRALLTELEQFARERGWSRLVLETGNRQPDAIRFYQREGFTPIPAFGYYVGSADSVCFEKLLVAGDPADDVNCESCQ